MDAGLKDRRFEGTRKFGVCSSPDRRCHKQMERDNMHLELCCDFTFRTGKQAKLKRNSFLYTVIVNLIFYPICDLRSVLIDRLIKLANIRLATVL